MAKNSKRRLLFGTILLTILIICSSYAILIPNVQAAMTSKQKGLSVLTDVIGVETAKYAVNTKEYPPDSYMGIFQQENVGYELNSNQSKLEMLYTFTNDKLHMIHVLENKGSPSVTKETSNILETATEFLNSYQSYSGNSFYGELASSLVNVNVNENLTKTVGNTKLEMTSYGERVSFRWVYTLNGVEAPDKAVTLTYDNGFLKLFFDSWNLYQIDSTSLNISEKQAEDIAIAHAKNYSWKTGSGNDTLVVRNFNVTGAKVIETVFRSSIVADNARNEDPLMLYPMRHVWVSLDKFYPPGNVYGFNVYIWADTGEIGHIQERFTTIDPPPEMVATIDDITDELVTAQEPAVEAISNSLTPILIALPAFAAIILGAAGRLRLGKKKKVFVRRFFKICGFVICLSMLSMILIQIVTVNATYPYGRATIWGSESIGAYRDPPGWSWRKHPDEVTIQQETAANIANRFSDNGYDASNYQGSNGLGSWRDAILDQIEDNEQNYARVAVIDFDHGNGGTGIPGLPEDEFHYMFEDNYGTKAGPTYQDSGPTLHEHAVYDKDIYDRTIGNTFFAFISTCNSAHVDDTFWGVFESEQGLVNGRARGMPFAWSKKLVDGDTTNPPAGYMSGDGYHFPDGGDFCYIGFLGGSAALRQTVSGSWPYYNTWIRQFFAYTFIYDMTVNDGLDHASASLWSGLLFDQTPLGNDDGFTAIWEMYIDGAWVDHYGDWNFYNTGWLKVYGNGEITLSQPMLTVNAYDSSYQQVSADVYIDNVYMGTAGNSFGVLPGYHTVRIDSSSNIFHNFDGYAEFDNQITVSVTQDMTVTANYYANPPPQYTLTVSAGAGGTTQAPYTPGNYQCTPGLVTVTAENYNDYLFDHWLLDDDDEHTENPIVVPMSSNHDLQAFFILAPSYNFVSYIDDYGGAVYDRDNLVGWQNDGQFATIEGYGPYQYFGWISGAMNDPSIGHIYMYGSGDGPLYVYVSSNGYNWNYVSNPYVSSGSPYWIDCGSYLSSFNYIAVTAEDPNYFYSISLDSVRVEPPEYYDLTIIAGPHGSTNPAPGVHEDIPGGTPYSVTADPDSGYVLDYWQLDGQPAGSDPTIIVPMNSDRTLEAFFCEGQVYHTLTVDAYDGYFGNPIYPSIWIDGDLKGYGYASVQVTEGTHTVLLEDPTWNDYGFYDYFSYFTDGYGNGANHPVYSDTYITAVYYPW